MARIYLILRGIALRELLNDLAVTLVNDTIVEPNYCVKQNSIKQILKYINNKAGDSKKKKRSEPKSHKIFKKNLITTTMKIY